jgi:hypothetical protein
MFKTKYIRIEICYNYYLSKSVYNENGLLTYYEDSNGGWYKQEYDSNDNQVYYEDSNGGWNKVEYDSNGKIIYYEDSFGVIKDLRNV